MKRPLILVSLIAGLAIAIAFGARYFEKVTQDVYVGFQGEARSNDYLAAERLLARLGHRVQRLKSLGELERMPHGSVVIFTHSVSRSERKRLISWVNSGGHLVTSLDWERGYSLGQDLGVESFWPELSPDTIPATQAGEAAEHPPVRVTFAGGAYNIQLQSRLRLRSKHGAVRASAVDRSGATLIQLARDKGRATLLSDGFWFSNYRIGNYDHARFLARVLGEEPLHVGFVTAPLAPSLSLWLYEHARWVLASAALLLVLFLWRRGARFGPIAPEATGARLSLRDHVVACGRFHWRHGRGSALLAVLREETQRALRRGVARPTLALPNGNASPPSAADEASASKYQPNDAAGFVRAVAALRRLRESVTSRE